MERTDFEGEVRALLAEVDREQERHARKYAAAKEALSIGERRRAALEETLLLYCELRGVPLDRSDVDEKLRERFKGMAAVDVVVELARERQGLIVAKDISRTLARAALYAHESSASGSLYGIMKRYKNLFEKVGPGRFILREMKYKPTDEADDQVAAEEAEQAEQQTSEPPVGWTQHADQSIQRVAG